MDKHVVSVVEDEAFVLLAAETAFEGGDFAVDVVDIHSLLATGTTLKLIAQSSRLAEMSRQYVRDSKSAIVRSRDLLNATPIYPFVPWALRPPA